MRFIVVTGGVISGLGKGITASSIGLLFKEHGYTVTAVKIDPYINVDAGTMSPFEHGECYVLDDGGEADLDLGNYERFLNITLTKNSNITTGKVYKSVIDKERQGKYLGKTVQIVPHVTNEIINMIEQVANTKIEDKSPSVCMVELGGTIGDIEGMPFVDALRQMNMKEEHSVCFVHVSLVPTVGSEMKSKPSQHSVQSLRSLGIMPNILVTRSDKALSPETVAKLSLHTNIPTKHIIQSTHVDSIYQVPFMFATQNVVSKISRALDLPILTTPPKFLEKYEYMAGMKYIRNTDTLTKFNTNKTVQKVYLFGKYTGSNDTYLSLIRALEHAGNALGKTVDVEVWDAETKTFPKDTNYGVVIPGGFGYRGAEEKLEYIKHFREKQIPILGICYGFQLMVLDWARHTLRDSEATSQEFNDKKSNKYIYIMEDCEGDMGGSMRLGSHSITLKEDSQLAKQYPTDTVIRERHRHRYEVNPEYIDRLETDGFTFTGRDGERMEVLELDQGIHPHYVGVQFHPEYKSRLETPHPVFVNFLSNVNSKI